MQKHKTAKELVNYIEDGKKKRKFKEKQGNTCVYCGCNNPLFLTIDHIIPKIRGGKDDFKNSQVCCYLCNQLKGPLSEIEFLEYLKALKIMEKLRKIKIKMNPFEISFDHMRCPNGDIDTKKEIKAWPGYG